MRRVVADTSVVAALHEGLAAAQRTRRGLGDVELRVSVLALAEAAAIEARRGVNGITQLVQAFPIEPLAEADAVVGGRLHGALRAAGHPKVSLVDCLMYATARRLGIDYATLDGDLRDQPGVVYIGP